MAEHRFLIDRSQKKPVHKYIPVFNLERDVTINVKKEMVKQLLNAWGWISIKDGEV